MRKIVKFRLRMYVMLTLIYIGVALLSMFIFYLLTPHEYFGAYPGIDVFYWLCGMGMIYFLDRSRANHPDKLLTVFMIAHSMKFLLTIALLVVGVKALGMDKATFAISLMCNYVVYTALELYIYHRFNKRVSARKCKVVEK